MQFGTRMGNGERPWGVDFGFQDEWEAKDADILILIATPLLIYLS